MSSSLFRIMSMGNEALSNARVGVDVTGHNISNAHTDGYSRQRVEINTRPPISYGIHVLGTGAKVATVERIHDKYLEGYVRRETQNNGLVEARTKGLSRLEGIFNPELTATVRQRMDDFVNSIREFSNFPDESATRTNLVEAATGVTQAFNIAHQAVTNIQRDCTNEMLEEVNALNQKISEIASLNQSIKEMSVGGGNANDLQDRRDILIKDVATALDVQIYNDQNNSLVIRGPNGALLVEGSHSGQLIASAGGVADKSKLLFQQAKDAPLQDLTNHVNAGKLAGLLEVRDVYAQNVRDELNKLAFGMADSFNAVHRQGFGIGGYSETNGRDFFSGIYEPGQEAAQSISVANLIVTDMSAISGAMSPQTPGDNIVANEMIRLFNKPVFDNNQISIQDYYDRMIGKVGIDSMRAQEEENASKIVMSQLHAQKEATSGVSLDEEAANLLKYQHLFAASSRIITTVDEMFETILGLKR